MRDNISICGSDEDDENLSNHALEVAEQVGRLIAQRGGVLICGGQGGVMKAACKGCKEENGITIGIMPYSKKESNEYVDVAIPTAIGNLRNYFVVKSGDVVIAIGGRWGTLSEVSFAMILNKPLILIKGTGGWVDEIAKGCLMQNVESTYYIVNSAEEAVDKAFEILGKKV